LGHTPNYGIGNSKFRKIVSFSVESLGSRFMQRANSSREPAEKYYIGRILCHNLSEKPANQALKGPADDYREALALQATR
jgi:hypothetical protein